MGSGQDLLNEPVPPFAGQRRLLGRWDGGADRRARERRPGGDVRAATVQVWGRGEGVEARAIGGLWSPAASRSPGLSSIGAYELVADFWDVRNYSSPRLMQDFYAGLVASEKPGQSYAPRSPG